LRKLINKPGGMLVGFSAPTSSCSICAGFESSYMDVYSWMIEVRGWTCLSVGRSVGQSVGRRRRHRPKVGPPYLILLPPPLPPLVPNLLPP
jgi:hypothetical protein